MCGLWSVGHTSLYVFLTNKLVKTSLDYLNVIFHIKIITDGYRHGCYRMSIKTIIWFFIDILLKFFLPNVTITFIRLILVSEEELRHSKAK